MSVRVGVAVVAVVLTVAGCSGRTSFPTDLPAGSSPLHSSSPPSNPPSPTVTTPRPTAPTLPPAARPDTPAAAQSFARYYIEVLDFASHTGEVELFRRLGNCGTCRAQAEGIEQFFSEGGRVEGGEIQITATEAVRFVRTAALINVTYDQSAGKSISRDGRTESSPELRAETFALTLEYSNGSWRVQKMQTVE